MVARRQELAAALIDCCAESPCRAKARRFLSGLSADELQFIAEYLGACILESARDCERSRAELAARIAHFQELRSRANVPDDDHKMILLLEFLCRSGVRAAVA